MDILLNANAAVYPTLTHRKPYYSKHTPYRIIFEPMNKPIRVEGIDVDIQLIFRQEHIELVLPHFQRVGLPSSVMDEMINAYIKSGETVSYERWFLEYGQKVINPLMNQKLGRSKDHPTFNNLLKHALKEILESNTLLKQFKNFPKQPL